MAHLGYQTRRSMEFVREVMSEYHTSPPTNCALQIFSNFALQSVQAYYEQLQPASLDYGQHRTRKSQKLRSGIADEKTRIRCKKAEGLESSPQAKQLETSRRPWRLVRELL